MATPDLTPIAQIHDQIARVFATAGDTFFTMIFPSVYLSQKEFTWPEDDDNTKPASVLKAEDKILNKQLGPYHVCLFFWRIFSNFS